MTEATKESPAPLDGFERAKPGEPLFTLQGGDPHAIKAVRYYIDLRRDAGIRLPEGPSRDAELLRCTLAEEVLWKMMAYLQGHKEDDDSFDEPGAKGISEVADLHSYRVKAARAISGMNADLNEIQDQLLARDWLDPESVLSASMTECRGILHFVRNLIEPRRMMKTPVGKP